MTDKNLINHTPLSRLMDYAEHDLFSRFLEDDRRLMDYVEYLYRSGYSIHRFDNSLPCGFTRSQGVYVPCRPDEVVRTVQEFAGAHPNSGRAMV